MVIEAGSLGQMMFSGKCSFSEIILFIHFFLKKGYLLQPFKGDTIREMTVITDI